MDINIKTNFLASSIIHIGHMGKSGRDAMGKESAGGLAERANARLKSTACRARVRAGGVLPRGRTARHRRQLQAVTARAAGVRPPGAEAGREWFSLLPSRSFPRDH